MKEAGARAPGSAGAKGEHLQVGQVSERSFEGEAIPDEHPFVARRLIEHARSVGGKDLNAALMGLCRTWGFDDYCCFVGRRSETGETAYQAYGEAEVLTQAFSALRTQPGVPGDVLARLPEWLTWGLADRCQTMYLIPVRTQSGKSAGLVLRSRMGGLQETLNPDEQYRLMLESQAVAPGLVRVAEHAAEVPTFDQDELRLIQLAARGMNTQQIAAELGRTARMIDYAFGRLNRRCGTSRRVETINFAVGLGLVGTARASR